MLNLLYAHSSTAARATLRELFEVSYIASRDDACAGASFEQKFQYEQEGILRFVQSRGNSIYTEEDIRETFTKNGAYSACEGGNEHDLLIPIRSEEVCILKLTNTPNGYGAKSALVDYLENLVFSNIIFGDDIELVGFVEPSPEKDIRVIRLLISQPFVLGNEASDEHIAAYMAGFGFYPMSRPYSYEHACGTRVYDARPANVLEDDNGNLFPIDVQIKHGERYVYNRLLTMLQGRCYQG